MHIGRGFHEVDAWAVHEVCLCVLLGKNERSRRRNRDENLNDRVFVFLIAFVFVSITLYCWVLEHNVQEIVIGNMKGNTFQVSRIESLDN